MWVALGKCLYTCEWVDGSCRLDSFHSLRKIEILLFFYLGIKGNAEFLSFYVIPKNQALHERPLYFPKELKIVNHGHISLTGTDHCISRLSKNVQLVKTMPLIFFSITENLEKIKIQRSFFESIVHFP